MIGIIMRLVFIVFLVMMFIVISMVSMFCSVNVMRVPVAIL